MGKKMNIFCKNTNNYISFTGGETLQEIFNRLKDQIDINPICARVNNKTEDMNYPVFGPKQVEFLSRESGSGHRVYIRSLCMILYKAVCDLFPGVRLHIEHSIAKGYYCLLDGKKTISDDIVDQLRNRMREIVAENHPFIRREQLTEDVIKIFERQGLADKVQLLKSNRELYTVYYELDNICDSYYGNLASTTGQIDTFNLIPYKDGVLLLGFDTLNPSQPAKPISQEKMFNAFTEYTDFNRIIGIKNVGELNSLTVRQKTADLINVAEALHEKKIGRISDEITRRYHDGGARIILIAGPSSSGKTTFTKRLAIQLMTNLLVPKLISLDDYFVNRVNTPLDEDGEYDFESLYALDLDTFNKDLNALLAGEEIDQPTYNFERGEREYRGNKKRLEKNSILLIE
ncbi:MAG: nucleoside kinase, partial [Muribaculaceae bacterium]|nr:nucleoside kinase [Muribaculaceae bacterium]